MSVFVDKKTLTVEKIDYKIKNRKKPLLFLRKGGNVEKKENRKHTRLASF